MESNIKSSFIPQASMAAVRNSGPRTRGGGFDLFILLGIVVFVASAVLGVGVFLYSQYLSTSATSKLEQLNRAKQAFEPSLINDLTRLDSRMRAADTILGTHIAPTTLFHLLEQLTLQTVSFTSFDFNSSSDGFTLVMKGTAESVNSIALQADLLAKSGVISNPIFSNINRQQNGVNFDFTADVNATALNYVGLVNGGGSGEADTQSQAPTSLFGTPEDGAQAPMQMQPQQRQQQMQPSQGQQGAKSNGPDTGAPPSL